MRDLKTRIRRKHPLARTQAAINRAVSHAQDTIREVIRDLDGSLRPESSPFVELPGPNARGNYPAAETVQAILANQIIEARLKAGLSQSELAKRAGVRLDSVIGLESAKHVPSERTIKKIDRALTAAGV